MTVMSHIYNTDRTCARCGTDLSDVLPGNRRVKKGDRIGVISGLKFSKNSGYLIRKVEFDSNEMCK